MRNCEEFETLHHFLRTKSASTGPFQYWVPEILVGGTSPRRLVNGGNPYSFYLKVMNRIAVRASSIKEDTVHLTHDLSSKDTIYQSHIRTFASLNGEIGTALKQIAFLPFLKEHIGITIFISLPTGVIGHTNRKGRRGSPFAIKNPFDIDDSLGDPLLPEFSPLFQYKALMQACHKLGILTGSIVPMSTLSIDSHLFKLFPELGFWWIAEAGEMLFCEPSNKGSSEHLAYTPPRLSEEAIQRFVPSPRRESVVNALHNDQTYYVANVEYKGTIHSITLANSFPDVVAGDGGTYTWGDVSTINYTSKPYPSPLGIRDQTTYEPSQLSWRFMPYVLAWRSLELGEEVFLIDVNSSVPEEILVRAQLLVDACQSNSSSIVSMFTDNFGAETVGKLLSMLECSPGITMQVLSGARTPRLRFIGEELWSYDIASTIVKTVVGPLIFCVSPHSHNQTVLLESLQYHLKMLEKRKNDNMFLAGVANHDTMPPLPDLAPLLYVIYYLLPNSIPFIFSGTEFLAQTITNKEFGFDTSPELLMLRNKLDDNKLGLFNDCPLDWTGLPATNCSGRPVINMCRLLYSLKQIRQQIASADLQGYRFIQLHVDEQQIDCFGYMRYSQYDERDALMVFANWSLTEHRNISTWPYAHSHLILSVNDQCTPSTLEMGKELTMAPCSAILFAAGTLQQHFQPIWIT